MKAQADGNNRKEQLYLDIKFYYKSAKDPELKGESPPQPYFFDFTNEMIALDF